MSAMDDQERLIDRWTRRVASIGFTGLTIMAFLTMFDSVMRWTSLPRIPGFSDIGEVLFALVIATCFPAGLLKGHNITIRFLGSAVGGRGNQWLETFGSLATLFFFTMLASQFFLLTLDWQINSRTTETLEFPIAPWWWLTTAIISLCVPVQFWVFWDQLSGAISGRVREPVTGRKL